MWMTCIFKHLVFCNTFIIANWETCIKYNLICYEDFCLMTCEHKLEGSENCKAVNVFSQKCVMSLVFFFFLYKH